jgi:hypothetical protein
MFTQPTSKRADDSGLVWAKSEYGGVLRLSSPQVRAVRWVVQIASSMLPVQPVRLPQDRRCRVCWRASLVGGTRNGPATVRYGEGALTRVPGKDIYRGPRLFVATLRYSRRSFRRVVWKSSQQTWAELHEQAWRYFGGSCRYVVLDNLKEGGDQARTCTSRS